MNRFETFAGLITDLNRCLQKLKDEEMGRFGLKAKHTMCLYYLGQNPDGLTATRLTELCSEDKAAISRTLKQLLEKGLIVCDLPENKRSYSTLYHLTDEGTKLVDAMNKRISSALNYGGSGLTDEERLCMYNCLETIKTNLTEHLERE